LKITHGKVHQDAVGEQLLLLIPENRGLAVVWNFELIDPSRILTISDKISPNFPTPRSWRNRTATSGFGPRNRGFKGFTENEGE
jgi:hypothetical protein